MNLLEQEIKSTWHHFFDAVHSEEDWITPLTNALDGLGVEQAFWRPSADVASIADILGHVSGHLEATLRAVLGMADQDYADWPATPEANEANWRTLIERLQMTISDLRRALHNWSLEEIYGVPRGRKSKRSTMITDILVHNAYHAGQIVKLRQAFESRSLTGAGV